MSKKLYTIGHGNLAFVDFLKLLRKYQINLVIDLRSVPWSKYVPHFNKNNLQKKLKDEGFEYIYFGDKLGGRPNQGWSKYYISEEYKKNIKKLEEIVNGKKSTILCSESDYKKCHRNSVAQTMTERGYKVFHILKDGTLDLNSMRDLEFTHQLSLSAFTGGKV
ncbi:MAG TPA: DUF488 domain-containing protein [Methanosarcinales archaeon]|nr:DUF488 domain-containing protein [Methanosarcinales archaeon]